jgi:hypothetical protein
LRYFFHFLNTAQSKESINMQKLAQSGHPALNLSDVFVVAARPVFCVAGISQKFWRQKMAKSSEY